jgi:hypothetical protein
MFSVTFLKRISLDGYMAMVNRSQLLVICNEKDIILEGKKEYKAYVTRESPHPRVYFIGNQAPLIPGCDPSQYRGLLRVSDWSGLIMKFGGVDPLQFRVIASQEKELYHCALALQWLLQRVKRTKAIWINSTMCTFAKGSMIHNAFVRLLREKVVLFEESKGIAFAWMVEKEKEFIEKYKGVTCFHSPGLPLMNTDCKPPFFGDKHLPVDNHLDGKYLPLSMISDLVWCDVHAMPPPREIIPSPKVRTKVVFSDQGYKHYDEPSSHTCLWTGKTSHFKTGEVVLVKECGEPGCYSVEQSWRTGKVYVPKEEVWKSVTIFSSFKWDKVMYLDRNLNADVFIGVVTPKTPLEYIYLLQSKFSRVGIIIPN